MLYFTFLNAFNIIKIYFFHMNDSTMKDKDQLTPLKPPVPSKAIDTLIFVFIIFQLIG